MVCMRQLSHYETDVSLYQEAWKAYTISRDIVPCKGLPPIPLYSPPFPGGGRGRAYAGAGQGGPGRFWPCRSDPFGPSGGCPAFWGGGPSMVCPCRGCPGVPGLDCLPGCPGGSRGRGRGGGLPFPAPYSFPLSPFPFPRRVDRGGKRKSRGECPGVVVLAVVCFFWGCVRPPLAGWFFVRVYVRGRGRV